MGYVFYGGRAGGEGCYRAECDHGVGERVHVDFDTSQPVWPLYLDVVLGYLDPAAHVPQYPREAQITLRRSRPQSGDLDPSSRYGRGSHKVRGPGSVGLDLVIPRPVNGGRNRETATSRFYAHAELPHQGHRDADVGPFLSAFCQQGDATRGVGCRQQQAAYELAALAPGDARLPAGDAPAPYPQGEPALFPGVPHSC